MSNNTTSSNNGVALIPESPPSVEEGAETVEQIENKFKEIVVGEDRRIEDSHPDGGFRFTDEEETANQRRFGPIIYSGAIVPPSSPPPLHFKAAL